MVVVGILLGDLDGRGEGEIVLLLLLLLVIVTLLLLLLMLMHPLVLLLLLREERWAGDGALRRVETMRKVGGAGVGVGWEEEGGELGLHGIEVGISIMGEESLLQLGEARFRKGVKYAAGSAAITDPVSVEAVARKVTRGRVGTVAVGRARAVGGVVGDDETLVRARGRLGQRAVRRRAGDEPVVDGAVGARRAVLLLGGASRGSCGSWGSCGRRGRAGRRPEGRVHRVERAGGTVAAGGRWPGWRGG